MTVSSKKLNVHPSYRPDIDGLRAVAVLAVMLFHAFPNNVHGGFVGVDIFFVISGFLISGIIFKGLEGGNFSFSEFYAHRVKRIFPALLIVLSMSYIVGWFVLLPDEFKQLGKHIAAGAAFVQNIELWEESGYFDNASALKPLLHLWSLAVEEQFYLIYPFLMLVVWRFRVNVLAVVIVVALLSFGFNVDGVHHDIAKTYFLPQTRLWELLSGSSLAYFKILSKHGFNKKQKQMLFSLSNLSEMENITLIHSVISIVGFLLIIASILGINKSKLFPGWWALAPVVGAVLLIMAGPGALVNRKILSSRFMLFVGVISYPLYLWHWPLLSFAQIMGYSEPPVWVRAGLLILSFFLAWLTYYAVEKPIRFGRKSWVKTVVPCVLMLAVGCVGYITFKHDGFSHRLGDRGAYAEYFDDSAPDFRYYKTNDIYDAYRDDCNFYDVKSLMNGHTTTKPRPSISPSCYTNKYKKTVFIWGDSHAEHLYFGLKTTLPKDISILQVASSGCPAQVGPKGQSEDEYCKKSNDFALSVIKKNPPDVVLISQAYLHDQRNDFKLIASTLKMIGVKKVIILGPDPWWDPFLYKLMLRKYWNDTPRYMFDGVRPDVFKSEATLKKQYGNGSGGFEYVSLVDFYCNKSGCLTYIGNNKLDGLITFDYGHLTPKASVFLSNGILKSIVVNALNSK